MALADRKGADIEYIGMRSDGASQMIAGMRRTAVLKTGFAEGYGLGSYGAGR